MPANICQFVPETSSKESYYLIQKPGHGWTLWYLGRDHLSLHPRDSVKEEEFATPEAAIDYCDKATLDDPLWAYFYERIFRGREPGDFPSGLGDRSRWVKASDSVKPSAP